MVVRILLGGSPCTQWSIAKNVGRETKASGIGWELFRNYLIAKEKFNPDFFLYENNWSASKDIKEQIALELGQPLQRINSNLVSAQNRDRFYCHNFGLVPLPEDRGIYLRDILDYKETDLIEKIEGINKSNRVGGFDNQGQGKRIYSTNGKSVCLGAGSTAGGEVGQRTGLYAIKQKSNVLCNVYGGKSQNGAVYGLNGKSKTLSAGTGIIGSGIGSSNSPKVIVPTRQSVGGRVYEVKNGEIEIKGKFYPIRLEDGIYEIRMLSVAECSRLQTLPDDYCTSSGISNTRAYCGLGNGWTAEVIIHLLREGLKDVDRNEKLEVLSMYDGIATGRYCLEQLGFKDIVYKAYEIDKYAIQVAMHQYPEIIQRGDAFQIREEDWYY